MKKIIIRIATLLMAFVLTVVLTVLFMNSESTDNMEDMDAPSLPVVLVDIDGTLTNRMYGYMQQMQVDFSRDTLTPVDTDRKISIAIKAFDQEITSLEYEVRTSDGSKVIENRTIKGLTEEDGYIRGTIQLENDQMLMNQEYSLQIRLDTDNGQAYYYTRVVQRSGLNTKEYVEFVQGFYQKCMNKEAISELSEYLETDGTASNNNFTSVTINSSADTVTWGDLSPQITHQGVPLIKDINETTGSVSIYYQISAKDEDGNTELYEVEDFYRMRYTQTRVMLLDFQRITQQIFDGSSPTVDEEGLALGITNKNIRYASNASADTVAFVQSGDLWLYSHSASKVVKVFSFRRGEDSDERDEYDSHNMKVLRIDESGDMDFIVYGYMNRGVHEGYVGTAVYHYSSARNAVEEKIFIPSTLSYEFLARDLDKLCYVNENDQMYILTESKLYKIDLQEHTYEVIEEGIAEDCMVVSDSNASVAWMNAMKENSARKIIRMDLDTGEQTTIKVKKGQYIKALGYMNEDLIYGITRSENVVTTAAGDVVFAMDEIKIEGFDGTVKKDYTKEGMYVTDVIVSDSLMEIQLSKWKNNQYEYQSSENIMNNKKAVEETVTLNSIYTQRQGLIMRLDFKQAVTDPEPVLVESKMQAVDAENMLDMNIEPQEGEVYYVYAYGRLDSIYTEPADAIIRADEMTGVVLNRSQQYIWERGNRKTKIHMDEAGIPQAILSGNTDAVSLQESLEQGEILDLTGCTLDEVLYQVSNQRPVITLTATGSLVIVGYDEYNTLVYHPQTGETSYMGLNDSTEAFEKAGNVFLVYMEELSD